MKTNNNSINEKILLIGGGGGVYGIARSLKHIRPNITTVQTMFDGGGHSGELRDQRGILPPGDITKAMLALADDEYQPDLRGLLSHRFAPMNGSHLDKATVRNILLSAFIEMNDGDLIRAIKAMCRLCRVRGMVLPISLDHSHLCVQFDDGSTMVGEGQIDTRSISDGRRIVKAFLKPNADIYVGAYDAIVNADKIVLCPGDLYTSIIPNTLVNNFRSAIAETSAKIILVTNLMTKKVETDGFTASCFARVLLEHIGRFKFDAVICNSGRISPDLLNRYKAEQAFPVKIDRSQLRLFAKQIVEGDLADQTGGIVRHNSRTTSLIAGL